DGRRYRSLSGFWADFAQAGLQNRHGCAPPPASALYFFRDHHEQAGDAMGLQIATRRAGDVSILDMQGRATIGPTNDALSTALRKLIDGGATKILLNLDGTTQIDSSSISTIVRAFVSLRNRNGSLKLVGASGSVKMVLEMLRLLNVIENFDDEAAALA